MTWNYRIIARRDNVLGGWWMNIHEVFYDKKNRIVGWTEEMGPGGSDKKEIEECLKLMLIALKKPVLVEKKIRGKEKLVELVE